MCPSPDSSAPAHATDLCLLSGHVRSRGLGLYTVDARANVGGSQEGRARHLGTAPMDCSCDALYGDTGLMALALIDAAKICWHDKCQHAEGRWIKCALDFSYTGRRSAGRPRWELIGRCPRVQIALNIADVSAPARTAAGATYGSTPPRHHLLLWPASLRWTRRLVMEARKWQGVLCVQPYWITCGWLISRRCRQPTRNALRADQGGFQSVC
jgi:hypothetical protein